MRLIDEITKFLSTIFDDGNSQNESFKRVQQVESEKQNKIPLNTYEVRKQEIKNSNEQIEGIYYLYGDKIIIDHYSECLISDKDNPCRKQMYHFKFFSNYMRLKFEGLSFNEKSIPRGRVEVNVLYIDTCFADNMDVINELKDIFRLPDKMQIISGKMYSCPFCQNI